MILVNLWDDKGHVIRLYIKSILKKIHLKNSKSNS